MASNGARIAQATVCEGDVCETSDLLVRGDQIQFVSVEQVREVGDHPLDELAMPSDIRLKSNFVLVQDTSGLLFDRCHMHIVRWHGVRRSLQSVRANSVQVARQYFGNGIPISVGEVEVPEGPWQRVAKVKYIRYRRYGYAKANYEHPFNPPVFLYATQRPLAWKLKLPNGCIVDERGFVRP